MYVQAAGPGNRASARATSGLEMQQAEASRGKQRISGCLSAAAWLLHIISVAAERGGAAGAGVLAAAAADGDLVVVGAGEDTSGRTPAAASLLRRHG